MKVTKRILAMLLAVMMMLTLAACDDKPETPETPDTPDAPAAVQLPTAEFTDYTVKFVGAETVAGEEGANLLRLYYDFTNKSEETESPMSAISFDFVQDGSVLEDTVWAEEEAEEDGNEWLELRPGASLRCIEEIALLKNEGVVTVTVYDFTYDEDTLKFDVDLKALPGKPAEAFVIAPVADPKFTDGLPNKGTYEEDYEVSVDSVERTKGEDGEDLIRVFYTFTNNADEEENMWFSTDIVVFQDGVELEEGYPAEETDTDEAYNEDIATGKTISASVCYELLSDSPIEVEFYDGWDATIGARFDVK
ncbi:MAG: DUF5067 domain-containing protein [Clostridia bacterium]|nr:DUF5067 domain-containing protein [Clostridia bacterium]